VFADLDLAVGDGVADLLDGEGGRDGVLEVLLELRDHVLRLRQRVTGEVDAGFAGPVMAGDGVGAGVACFDQRCQEVPGAVQAGVAQPLLGVHASEQALARLERGALGEQVIDSAVFAVPDVEDLVLAEPAAVGALTAALWMEGAAVETDAQDLVLRVLGDGADTGLGFERGAG
jgi:hypothetical protein